MSRFTWVGDRTILYKGRLCELTEHDGWEVVNAMRRVDEEENYERKRLKEEIKSELLKARGVANNG